MALSYSTLTRPANPQVVDPSTGRMRDEWQLYFDRLTTRLNATVGVDTPATDAEYLVGAADATLTAERVVTDTASITWNLATIGQAKAERAALTGDVTASANDNALTVANNVVSYAKMQDVSATSRILGRKTTGAGDPEECTLSDVLDFIGSAAQGDLLYRGASAWARLAAGTSGQFLQTLGAGANPQWANDSVVPLTSGTVSSAATLDLSLSTADMYEIDLINFAPATDNVTFQARLSQSGTFLTGATDYDYGFVDGNDAPETSTGATQINITSGQGNNTNENLTVTLRIFRPSASGFRKTLLWNGSQSRTDSSTFPNHGRGRLMNNTNAIDGVRFLFSSGNIASGFYAMRSYSFT